jgi:CelD/BcsL family acetyltransferase involved in cellulose biosynthesis
MTTSTPLTSFREIQAEWEHLLALSPVNTLYLTPQWQEVWWNTFGDSSSMVGFYLRTSEGIKAIASLARHDDTISFLGNRDTFDYNDFMVQPGYEAAFFPLLLDCLEAQDWKALELFSLVETSPTLVYLPELARQRGYTVEIREEDVAPGIALPNTWEDYLDGLSKKDRHELRRKFRRLEAEHKQGWCCLTDLTQVTPRMGDFIKLMRQSRADKDIYMTPEREQFFHRIARSTSQLGMLRLFFLEINEKPVATALCFDYGTSRLLYNSGYDPAYSYYSVGLLLNALSLRDAIEKGQRYFDFLRGPEPYKYHLGGQNRILYQMVVKRS